jgi:hypothetical protein
VRATDAAVEDRPGIGEGGRPLCARGAEKRGLTLGIRPLDRRSRLGGPRADRLLARRGPARRRSSSPSRATVGRKTAAAPGKPGSTITSSSPSITIPWSRCSPDSPHLPPHSGRPRQRVAGLPGSARRLPRVFALRLSPLLLEFAANRLNLHRAARGSHGIFENAHAWDNCALTSELNSLLESAP